jgi:hypothetical protein
MANKDLCYPFELPCRQTLSFGATVTLANGKKVKHSGIDFGSVDLRKKGKPALYAPCDGEILKGNDKLGGYCIAVYSKKENVSFIFWHIGKRISAIGAQVKRGEKIGEVGKSGVYAEHTHFQTEKGRSVRGTMTANTLDPKPFMQRMELRDNLIKEEQVDKELKAKVDLLTKELEQVRATNKQLLDEALQSQNSLKIKQDELDRVNMLLEAEQRATRDLQNDIEQLKSANQTLNDKMSAVLDEAKKKDKEIESLTAYKLLHENGSLPIKYYIGLLLKKIAGKLPKN